MHVQLEEICIEFDGMLGNEFNLLVVVVVVIGVQKLARNWLWFFN